MNKPIVYCLCGRRVPLTKIGGQYQYSWFGTCPECGRDWSIDCEAWAEEHEEGEEEEDDSSKWCW